MRYIQSIGISVQANLPDSDAVYTEYRCKCTYVCPVFNRPMTFSRVGLYLLVGLWSRSVSHVSSAARQSCVAGSCGVIGRGFRGARGVRRREYLILYAAEPMLPRLSDLCSGTCGVQYYAADCAAVPMLWPTVRLEGPSTLGGVRSVLVPRAVKESAGSSKAE